MKNILTITSYKIFPAHSGGQKGIVLFYKYFVKYQDVLLVGTKNNDSSNTDGIRLLKVFGNSKFRYANLFYFFSLQKIVKENKTDIIIVEQPYMGIFGILLKYLCKKKLVIHSHNIEGNRFKDLKKWWACLLMSYEKRVHRIADFSFFINEEDRDFALRNFHLKKDKTAVITYGTEIAKPLSAKEKNEAALHLKSIYNIPNHKTILLFNGIFGYEPNDKALYLLVEKIMPLLLQKSNDFVLLICGKNIPDAIKKQESENILIKGFVDDINAVFKGAEIFLNPIWLGGGIKTKLVEALSCGASGVSFKSGAIGVPQEIIEEKLFLVEDENVEAFAEAILQQQKTIANTTPQKFYDYFYWDNIARKAAACI